MTCEQDRRGIYESMTASDRPNTGAKERQKTALSDEPDHMFLIHLILLVRHGLKNEIDFNDLYTLYNIDSEFPRVHL